MKPGIALAASLIAACSLAFSAQAAPPEGKGPSNSAGHPGKGNPHASGNPGKGNSGNNGKGNNGKGNHHNGKPETQSHFNHKHHVERGRDSHHDDRYERRRHDDRYRHDGRRHSLSDNFVGDLVYAGITAALAREYAYSDGLRGYSSLPPGIRKNLARGKPLPPGIAKKTVPGSFLNRLPRYPGYEWRVAGSDLVLIAVATGIIADVLFDVFD